MLHATTDTISISNILCKQNMHQLSIYIFRRDLRLHDNTALHAALNHSEQVIPCFIFDPRQISEKNNYRSEKALHFMQASLLELAESLKKKGGKLFYFHGESEKIILQLIKKLKPDAIYVNRDYTPFSTKRDKKIKELCTESNVQFNSYGDALLTEPEQILKQNNEPYTVFTPFMKKAFQFPIRACSKNIPKNFYISAIDFEVAPTFIDMTNTKTHALQKSGRKAGLQLIKKIGDLDDYANARDYPSANKSTQLSAHLKFGTVSIREVYFGTREFFPRTHPLIKELYWRDFFTHIAFHFPHVFHSAFHKVYNHLAWENDETKFERWREGKTGYPIVDAGMRELNETGYLCNRLRMITASFLVKELNVNWQLGEKYFAQQLIDYDPALNNGNWQWVASTGCDAQPYFRIFNPWLQQKKYDAECIYIKKWLPELKKYSAKEIHNFENALPENENSYPAKIIERNLVLANVKRRYAKCKEVTNKKEIDIYM